MRLLKAWLHSRAEGLHDGLKHDIAQAEHGWRAHGHAHRLWPAGAQGASQLLLPHQHGAAAVVLMAYAVVGPKTPDHCDGAGVDGGPCDGCDGPHLRPRVHRALAGPGVARGVVAAVAGHAPAVWKH